MRIGGRLLQTKVIFFLYRAAWLAAAPCLLLYVLWRAVRDPRYLRSFGERLGFWNLKYRTAPGSIWLHAVSVGEALSAVEIIRRMRSDLPHTPVYVSCTTLAGREVAASKLSDIADGIFYAPMDTCWAVRRVLRRIRPSVLVVLETEIWPNLYREAKRSGASVVVVNARIGDKAAESYTRFRWFFSAVLAQADHILAQSAQDERRYIAAGALPETVCVAGNLKYDFQPCPGDVPAELLSLLRRPLWICASTTGPMHSRDVDEDDVILTAYREVAAKQPDVQLLIAPRKPERFEIVGAKLRDAGIDFVRRSEIRGGEAASVVLLDSVGELSSLFPHADAVFMGGTLAERGGHNILEPALCAKPVIAGPHLENFAAIRDRFAAASGYIAIEDGSQLAEAVSMLLQDPGLRESLGARARALAEAERGATSRAMRVIAACRWEHVPASLPWGFARPLLWALSLIWVAGGKLKRRMVKTRALETPVISVGGMAMGGVGKTPMVRYLAGALGSRGYRVAALTRGYRRRSRGIVCLPKGSRVPVPVTGDEAQLLLRSCDAGIGADRWTVGRRMEEQFEPELFLLDDGFQHARLARTVDLLLLDGIDPLAGDAPFPLGRLREPESAMARADIIVITRAGGRRFDGLMRRLPKVPVFLADVEVNAWIPERPALGPIAAFCGLANPAAFFETIRESGIPVVLEQAFPDHHRYTREELQDLARQARLQGAIALVTTEKDFVNLPDDAGSCVGPLKIIQVAIRMRIRNESGFLTQLDLLLGLSSRFNGGCARL